MSQIQNSEIQINKPNGFLNQLGLPLMLFQMQRFVSKLSLFISSLFLMLILKLIFRRLHEKILVQKSVFK